MKLGLKVGDKVKVNTGKFAGKEAAIAAIDKKNFRVKLEGIKVSKVKTKAGQKDLHGTFHATSLTLIKPEAPAAEAPAAEAAAQA